MDQAHEQRDVAIHPLDLKEAEKEWDSCHTFMGEQETYKQTDKQKRQEKQPTVVTTHCLPTAKKAAEKELLSPSLKQFPTQQSYKV